MTNYPPPPPAYGQPAPVPPNQRPWWKATWALIAAGLIVGIAIGAGAGGSAAKTKKETIPGPTVTASFTETDTATTLATVTTTPTKVIATHTRVVVHTYTPPPPHQYGEGTYVVGVDIKPGLYRTTGADPCYWARLSSLDTSDIIDNSNSTGQQTIQIRSGDKAFEVEGDCTFGKA